MSELISMGEISTLTKNTKQFASLKTTIPISIVKQWKLKSGDQLDWSWEIVKNEMKVVVSKVVNVPKK